jgi:hypothetical protein
VRGLAASLYERLANVLGGGGPLRFPVGGGEHPVPRCYVSVAPGSSSGCPGSHEVAAPLGPASARALGTATMIQFISLVTGFAGERTVQPLHAETGGVQLTHHVFGRQLVRVHLNRA